MSPTNLSVVHHQKHNMFFVKLQHEQAQLNYKEAEDNLLDLVETRVPAVARGIGIGSAIVGHVLEYARRKHLKVIPTCPFVANYVSHHPEYEDVVVHSRVNSRD